MHLYKKEFQFQITGILCWQLPFWKVLSHVNLHGKLYWMLLLVCVSFRLLHTCTCKTSSSEATIPILQVVSKSNTNCSVSTACVILWRRNSSSASEFKEFRLKLWDHRPLFLEFYILFLKTLWKAYPEAVNQGQMDSAFSLFAYLHKLRKLLSVHLNRVK